MFERRINRNGIPGYRRGVSSRVVRLGLDLSSFQRRQDRGVGLPGRGNVGNVGNREEIEFILKALTP